MSKNYPPPPICYLSHVSSRLEKCQFSYTSRFQCLVPCHVSCVTCHLSPDRKYMQPNLTWKSRKSVKHLYRGVKQTHTHTYICIVQTVSESRVRPFKCPRSYINRIKGEQSLRQKVGKFCQELNCDKMVNLIKYTLIVQF